jgi:hypothetical protein
MRSLLCVLIGEIRIAVLDNELCVTVLFVWISKSGKLTQHRIFCYHLASSCFSSSEDLPVFKIHPRVIAPKQRNHPLRIIH